MLLMCNYTYTINHIPGQQILLENPSKKNFKVSHDHKLKKLYKTSHLVKYFLLSWLAMSAISLIGIPFQYILNPFILFSIAFRGLVAWLCYYFYKRIFVENRRDESTYLLIRTVSGYGIFLTYVFFMFPMVVQEHFTGRSDNLLFIVLVVLSSLSALLTYISLITDEAKVKLEFYNKKEIQTEKERKKSKKLQKKHLKDLRITRTVWENIWFEWVDPVLYE
jgi:hypothetical protein